MLSRLPLASRLGGGAAVGSGSSVNAACAAAAVAAGAGAGSSSLRHGACAAAAAPAPARPPSFGRLAPPPAAADFASADRRRGQTTQAPARSRCPPRAAAGSDSTLADRRLARLAPVGTAAKLAGCAGGGASVAASRAATFAAAWRAASRRQLRCASLATCADTAAAAACAACSAGAAEALPWSGKRAPPELLQRLGCSSSSAAPSLA